MKCKTALTALVFSVASLTGSVASAQQATPKKPATCFVSSQFENWKAADAKTIYIRVRSNRYYRLDLAAPCQPITWPGAFLVMKMHGPASICSAIDWDLHVAQSWHDTPQACVVKTMTELSAAEVAALPSKSKP